MTAVLDYLRSKGIETQENSWDSDAAIIWSVLWHGRMAPNELVYAHYRSLGKPVIIIDVGALIRGETWKLAVNNITSKGYYGHTTNLDWDRPSKLGIERKINFSTDPAILIAAQHNRSLQVAELPGSIEEWIMDQVITIRSMSDRPIRIRPHPRCWLNMHDLPSNVTLEHPKQLLNTYDSFNMRFDCHAVVNYNSGPSIQAALSGTRLLTDSSSLAHPMSIWWDKLEKSYTIERDSWLTEICHTEYTVNELRQGIWLKRIEPALIQQ